MKSFVIISVEVGCLDVACLSKGGAGKGLFRVRERMRKRERKREIERVRERERMRMREKESQKLIIVLNGFLKQKRDIL